MPKTIERKTIKDIRSTYPPEIFELVKKQIERKEAVYRELHANRSAASKKGWERRRRREAALKGWDKRRARTGEIRSTD